MQRSTAVESVPEASRPIRLANGITLTKDERRHDEGNIPFLSEERQLTVEMLKTDRVPLSDDNHKPIILNKEADPSTY